jgi:hypothetical protein
MTPKEKAQDIYLKMLQWEYNADIYMKRNVISTSAKKCALIAVYEIYNSGLLVFVDDEQYWHEVKQEMEKL